MGDSTNPHTEEQDEGINIFSHRQNISSNHTQHEPHNVENGKKELLGFTEEQKRELLKKEIPELLDFLDVFQKKATDLKEKIDVLTERLIENPQPTDEGVSYINVKFHLMLCYLENLSYYLHCKSSGMPVNDHPVILQLIRLKTILEKIRPLDNKLKYQIEKLLRMAVLQSTDDKAFEESKLAHKANIKNFAPVKDDGDNGIAPTDPGKTKYVPPRRHAVVYDDAKSRAEKKEERQIERAKTGRMVELLKELYSDAPESQSATSEREGESRKERKLEESITQYEEDTMRRLSETKKKGTKKKKRGDDSGLPDALAELESYSDLAALSWKEQDQAGIPGGPDSGGPEDQMVEPFVVGGEEDDDYEDEDMPPPKKRPRRATVGDTDRIRQTNNNQKKWLKNKQDKRKQNKFPSSRGRRKTKK